MSSVRDCSRWSDDGSLFFFGHFCCCCLYMACVCGRFWWLFNGTAKFFFSFVWLLSSISWCKVRGKRQTHLTRKCRKSKFNRCVKGNSLMTRHSTPSLFQISKLEKKKKLINWFWPKNGCDFDWFICLVHFNSISNASPLHRDLYASTSLRPYSFAYLKKKKNSESRTLVIKTKTPYYKSGHPLKVPFAK